MATVTVSADNTRIAEANITNDTGTWGNDGGGGGVSDEPDFYYQGGAGSLTAQSRKVSTSLIGRSYTHGSGTNMTVSNRSACLMKLLITNKDALLPRTSPGSILKVGSSSGAYFSYYLFGNDNYPKRGGFQLIAIDPNVSGYRNATAGSPSLTSILYWSWLADFSSTSKSENLIIDAIDIGAGLNLVGGDGASADGTFQNFLTADEGTVANSWGYVYSEGPFIFVNGKLTIGENTSGTAINTGFTDSGKALNWNNGLFSTGFAKFKVNLAHSGSIISIDGCNFFSDGEQNNTADRSYTTTEDTRAELEVTGSLGSLSFTGNTISNYRSISLTSGVLFRDNTVRNSGITDLNSEAVSMLRTSILASAIPADSSSLIWNSSTNPNGYLDNMNFSKGSNSHHAIEFGTSSPTTITLTGIDFVGFNTNNAQNDSHFYIARTSGTVDITLVGCSTDTVDFSYKTAGATVNIINDINITISNLVDNTEVRVLTAGTDTELAGTENATSGTPNNRTFTFALPQSTVVDIFIVNKFYENIEIYNYTVPSTDQTLLQQQRFDRNYLNP